ncbi:serine/threonine protein kinase [Streptomyces sp. NBC_01294]|uniref:serine/threonine protein kinase n=1 Tax=Streptomyces sp. NBC_01294 TaxID=2903815 RepID=UPI002DD81A3B|nr:protein kinase [Streptomyces sp. NBC_01294]WRZ58699.1 protein kinase [Streptomyces sp. NBC_01294]
MHTAGSGGRVQPARPGDPTRIGPYRIIGRLGSGGMGTVHAALSDDGTRVAVKVVHPAQADDPEFRARFRREVQLSARVSGPCLIPLLAADPEAELPWLATAYAPGPTLNQHLAAHGPLTGSTLYAFATGTAQALAAIHAAGVIHRDVKPQNVILSPAGPRVLDFGIAHAADGTSVTRTGVMTGTPGWISPEHYRTGTAGPAGDVFAWGALVAYAATGRLPFGTGAPDVVAFRVMSGDPDLDGIRAELREVVSKALAKEPGHRISAICAAESCSLLLSDQSTQVLPTDAGPEPTRVGALVAEEWRVPPVDDPAWPAPPGRPWRRKAAGVLAAAAVVGGITGGALAFPTNGSGDRTAGAAQTPGASSGSPSGTSPSAPDQAADPAGTSGEANTPTADPRGVRAPADPLAGIPNPAYTRADDTTQPHDGEWAASTRAATPEEEQVEKAIRDQVKSVLATKAISHIEPVVTFNRRAQTVMVTSGPVPQIPDDHTELFGRAGEMAACTVLAHRLKGHPTTWPYGRYAVYGKDADGSPAATLLDFGEATTGCHGEVAGKWQGDETGMETAQMPSSDKAEIRVADDTVKAINTVWDARVAEGNGPVAFDRDDAVTLGFDPVEKAAYVWAWDGYGALSSRAQQGAFQHVAEKTLCKKLVAEYTANRNWGYTRWSVGFYTGNSGVPVIIGSGDCLPQRQ